MSRIVWDILRGSVTFLEALVMTHFVFAFQGLAFNRKGLLKYIISTLLFSFLILVTFDSIPSELIKGIVNIAYFFTISLLFTKEKVHIKLLTAAICVVVDIAVKIAVPAGFEDVFFRFLAQTIKLIVYGVVLQAAKNKDVKLGKKEWIMIFSVMGLSFAGIALLNILRSHASGDEITFLLCLEICFILIAAVCFYMTVLLNKSQKESERLKLISQQNEFRSQYAENAKKQYDDIQRMRHDIKQTYLVILALLKEKKFDEVFDFIQTNTDRISYMEVLIDVGDDVINALLNAKLISAKQQGIKIICNVDSRVSDIDKVDLCNLLGNMLDNAIEACVKCGKERRIIEVGIKRFDEIYFIEISNSVSGNVFEENKLLKTTKSNAELHGFGIKSIQSIAEKYGGSVNFVQEDDIFRCDVILMK